MTNPMFGRQNRGYIYEGLDRGGRFAPAEEDQKCIDEFMYAVSEIANGATGSISFCQHEAYSDIDENVRDIVVHSLGLLFDIDVDLLLSQNEQAATFVITPAQKAILKIDDPDIPLRITGTKHSASFGFIPGHVVLNITEFEFTSFVLTEGGVRNRMMRIITCSPLMGIEEA